MGENQPACSFTCEQYDKICKTQRGLTRHKNTNHVETSWKDGPTYTEKNQATPESKLHPSYFKAYVKKSVSKLSNDECYSQNTRDEFLKYAVNFNDTNYTHQLVRNVIGKFKGGGEKFYQEFYKWVTGEEIAFKNISRKSSIILGFEVANHVLAHLTGFEVANHVLAHLTGFEVANHVLAHLTGLK